MISFIALSTLECVLEVSKKFEKKSARYNTILNYEGMNAYERKLHQGGYISYFVKMYVTYIPYSE